MHQEAGSCFARGRAVSEDKPKKLRWAQQEADKGLQCIPGKQIWGKSSVKQPRVIFLSPEPWKVRDCLQYQFVQGVRTNFMQASLIAWLQKLTFYAMMNLRDTYSILTA